MLLVVRGKYLLRKTGFCKTLQFKKLSTKKFINFVNNYISNFISSFSLQIIYWILLKDKSLVVILQDKGKQIEIFFRNDNDLLEEEIINQYKILKSVRKVGLFLNVGKTSVENILIKRKVKMFPRTRKGEESSSRKRISPYSPSAIVRNKEIMSNLYLDKKLSTPEIGKLLNVSSSTVHTGLTQCGIKLRTKKESLKGKPKLNIRGPKNYAWRGGTKDFRKRILGRLIPIFTNPVKERDNFTCQYCGSKKELHVHHHKRRFWEIVNLIRERKEGLNDEQFLDAVVKEHKLEDGLTLCQSCHIKYHKENGK